jgi:phage FluMu gp28-like protein
MLERAVAEGMNVNLDDCWAMAKGDERLFDQFFRCSFLDGEEQYIPSRLIEQCRVDDTTCRIGDDYAGLDIGRTKDISSLYVVRCDEQRVRWVQQFARRKRTSETDLDDLVALAFSPAFRLKKLTIDATGMGSFPAERYQRRYGSHRVEAFTFTNPSKEELATGLYQAFAAGTVKIHRADEDLMRDIASIRRIVTKAGNVSYDAPHTDAGHADNAWALALALWACSKPPNYRYELRG